MICLTRGLIKWTYSNYKMPIKFLANHNTIVFGQTGSGKTYFILEVIKRRLIHPFPSKIFYMYGARQAFMDHIPEVTFIEGLDFSKVDVSSPSMVILDDLLNQITKDLGTHFIMSSHHHKISLFFLTQSLFPNNDTFRLISANAHYIVVFENQRNFRQVHCLAHQIFVGKEVERILAAYKRASESQRGFILLSFAPTLPRELTVLTDYWSQCPSVYL